MQQKINKIFGIGLQRTGTTSLNKALNILGFESVHGPYGLFNNWDDPILSQYDAFTDNPIPLIYKELDKRFPGSKFILTTREVGSWLKSVEWLFTKGYSAFKRSKYEEINQIHLTLYGTKQFEEDKFRQTFREHHREVKNYFSDRAQDLLVLNFSENLDWKPLCRFLNVEVPDIPFPHKHKSTLPLTISSQLKNKLFKLFGSGN